MISFRASPAAIACFLLLHPLAVAADVTKNAAPDSEGAAEDDLSARRLEFMIGHAKGYSGTSADGRKIVPIDKLLLRWTNPSINVEHGIFVGWTDETGRPMAVAQVYLFPGSQNSWFMEQQSLAPGPMTFKSPGDVTWSPTRAGVKWTRLSKDVPRASSNEKLRLTQMRGVARRFRVDDEIDGNSVLRLLPTPLIRYSAKDEGLIDGALFSMVSGTDPEATLQIEIREEADSEESAFYWALSPMTTFKLYGYLDGEEVWSAHGMQSHTAKDVFHGHRLPGRVD